jgi:hypothetical protein
MTTLSHDPAQPDRPARRPWTPAAIASVAASVAISVMWLVVLFVALYGPDILHQSGAGTTSSSVPSAVVVAPFAFLGTWVVARRAFPDGG